MKDMIYEDDVHLTQAEYYMQECFELAKQALGRTSPNPIVGAIVLDKDSKVVGRGYHKHAGIEHAELVALKEAGEKANGGTLVVNLEPCCHYGKTPPCTDLILKSKIKEVIFSNYDLNPLVNGKSEKIFLEKGIKVIPLVLESEGKEVNKFYFKWIKTRLPWITLKQAQTINGIVGVKNQDLGWISCDLSRKEVHSLRNIYDAVLVGANTVCSDNPELTVRDIKDFRNPLRIVLDPSLKTKPNNKIYNNNSNVFLVTRRGHPESLLKEYESGKHISILELTENDNKKINLNELFLELGKRNILSILVEAGPCLSGELISNGLIDEYILFVSPRIFSETSSLPSIHVKQSCGGSTSYEFRIINYKTIGNDLMVVLRPVLFS